MREPPVEGAVERRIVSVLFCDLVGFTSLSEALDAEDVATIQDAYFAMVRETVARYGGRLEKFIGDAAMAVFGIPRSRDDDVQRAVRAGLAIVGGIQQIGARLGLDDEGLRVRVGVNTGEVVVAASGADEGRVTGDTVNTAARLQAAAAPMAVAVGEATALAVADMADLEPIGGLELKGKSAPVRAWVVHGVRPEASRERAMGSLRAPTLGRDAELDALSSALERVGGGAVERWLIVAPPGVGKSRLLREFGEGIERSGIVWRTRCRADVLSPFDPIARLLRDALGGVAGSAAQARLRTALATAGATDARTAVVVEAVTSVLGGGEQEHSSHDDREALFAAWLDALDALAGGATQAWLVEDVHWAGGDVLAFLELAGSRKPARSGRLVIATARPSLLDTNPDWAAPDDGAGHHLLRLTTLQPTDAAALVSALVGDALPDALVGQIAERSDGNCLFIEELVRTWVSVGTLVADRAASGTWRLAVPADEIALPTSVQAIYAAQLDDLPPIARTLARRASVAGRRFPVRALESIGAAESRDEATAGLDPLRRRDLVTGPLSEPIVGEAFAYRHALLRDAGYASLARAERARLHVRLARWLEGAAGDRSAEVAEQIAGNYAAALDSAPALAREVDDGLDRTAVQRLAAAWFEQAGTAALALSAQDAARTLYRRSIDLTAADDLADLPHRWELLGDATAYAADMDEGAADYERAIEIYRRAIGSAIDDGTRATFPFGLARTVGSLCAVWYQQLRFAESADLADATIRELGETDKASRARLLMARSFGVQGAIGHTEQSNRDMAEALELARTAGNERLELKALAGVTHVRAESGLATIADWQAIERMAARLGDRDQQTAAITNARMQLLDDNATAVYEWADRAREIALTRGHLEDAGWADYLASEAALVSGDWDRALEIGLRAIEVGIVNAYRRLTVRTWFVLVPIALARADRQLLERASEWFDQLSGPFPDSPYARVMRPAQDLSFAESGIKPPFTLDVEPRLASYQEEPAGPSWTAAADRVFRSWLEEGNVDGAARIMAAMTDALPRFAKPSSLGMGTYELLRGRLALARGDRTAAANAARAALARFRVSQAPWWIAKAIRLAERAGIGDAALAAEVIDIERRLGTAGATP